MQQLQSEKDQLTLPYGPVSYWTYNPQGQTTIVMTHGFRGNHYGLEDIVAELPAKYRIIVPDLPGFGESPPLKQPHTIDGYREFLQQFIASLSLPTPPVLLGHSFGSIVAAHFTARHTALVDKLVLVNPIATPPLRGSKAALSYATVFYYWLGSKLPERVGHELLSNKAIVLTMSVLLAKTKDKTLRRRIHKNHLTHFSSFQSRKVVLEAFKASVNHTVTDVADKITVPTLLIAGEADDIAPLHGQQQLARRIPSTELAVIPKVGHLIHHEAADKAASAIQQFIDNK